MKENYLLTELLLPCFLAYNAFGLNLVTRYPTSGENNMLTKKDHCTPIFLFLPIVSETTNEKTYHAINMKITIYSFIA